MKYSFTSRKTLDQCNYKFYRIHVARDVKNAMEGPALVYGNDMHKALETALVRNRKLPKVKEHAQWALDYVNRHTGLRIPEQFVCVDKKLQPCDGRSPQAFNSGKLDVVTLRAADADIFDYKTGKHSTDMTQLQDSAVFIFALFPTVVQVRGHLVFTEQEGVVETETFRRESMMDYVAHWYDAADDVKAMSASGTWKKTTSGLCPYCPVHDCENHPGGRR